jgi:hypothetical protein
MDSLIITNLTQTKPSRIVTTADEERYYLEHDRRLRLPAFPAASIVAVAGLFLLAVIGFPA